MYDWSFFCADMNFSYYIVLIARANQILFGIGAAILSNFIAFTVLYVICKKSRLTSSNTTE